MNQPIRMVSRIVVVGTLAACLLAACRSDQTGSKTAATPSAKAADTGASVIYPKRVEQYDGTPYWLVQSKNWPAVMTWTLDSTGEYELDSLRARLTGTVIQSWLSGPKGKEHPLISWFELTVRPLPLRITGRSFNIDSVLYFDPIRKKRFPAQKMLSQERFTEKGVVRTRFTTNLAVMYSPELTENQLLEPTVYITSVDTKTIVVHMPPIPVAFLKSVEPSPTPDTLIKWGPS
jgi:hypothetical protein